MKKLVSLFFCIALAHAGFAQAPQSKFKTGEKLADIKLKDLNGKLLKLSSIKGKMVLVDFWASWCRPCRMENPNLIAAYNKYKDTRFGNAKGFDIYSVSIDRNAEAWKKAVESDALPWKNHVIDGQTRENSIAYLWNIQFIPQNYLINEKGEIIAKNLRGELLEEELKKLLK